MDANNNINANMNGNLLVELYSGSIEGLTKWCQTETVLLRYMEHVHAESEHIADADLLAYLKTLRAVCDQIAAEGCEATVHAQASLFDSLLTDIFSIASYESWDHPMLLEDDCYETCYEIDSEGLSAPGLLGYDQSKQGAQIYVIDRTHLVLSRQRAAGKKAGQS